MPKKGIEELIKEFIKDLLTKFTNLRESLTEKFVVEDVWECILDFQKKVNEDAGGPTFVDSRIRNFLFNVSKVARSGKIDFNKVKNILEDERSLKGLEDIKSNGYNMGSLFNAILEGVEKAKKADDDVIDLDDENAIVKVEIKKEKNDEDDNFELLEFDKKKVRKLIK